MIQRDKTGRSRTQDPREHGETIQSLRDAAAKLEAVISNYSGIIWSIDRDQTITLLNGLYIKQLGLTPASYEGWRLDDVQHHNERLHMISHVQKTFDEGPQDWIFEEHGKTFHAHNTPIFDDDGEITHVVGTIEDITEMTRLQSDLEAALREAQRANAAKSDFLASMSHEMRTPLNAVIGLSGLSLEDGGLSEETRANIEKTYGAGQTLLSIINDILDISKIEAGKLELIPLVYDVPSMINDTVTQNILRIGEKPIDFVLDIGGDMYARLDGDELRLRQIINNLLSNAIKYTREGTVGLHMRALREDNMVRLTIRVSDTGSGIRAEDVEKLFADYSQLDQLTNRTIEGTGLGLPITKKLVEMMGGTISVTSEYGKGSVFAVELSQSFVSDTRIGVEVAENLKEFRYTDSKRDAYTQIRQIRLPYARVLLVDDNLVNLDVARGLMKPYGMQVDCVTGGQQAVDAIRDEKVRYNAIFMDHMMPGMDGIEATLAIRNIGTAYASAIPIIALTANAIVGNEEMFLSKGFQAFLSKPIDILRLDEVIRRWVRDKDKEKTMVDPQERRRVSSRRSGIDRRKLSGKYAGLDFEKGLRYFGGSEETWLQVLRSYTVNTRPLLASITDVGEADLEDYAVIMHGIKGSSRGIFADMIGDSAENLEKAARAGDFGYVSHHNPTLIEAIGKLISDLEDTLDAADDKASEPIKDKPDEETLARLLAACRDYQMDTVEEIMTELERCSYTADDGLVSWLREKVELTGFQQIIGRLSALIG